MLGRRVADCLSPASLRRVFLEVIRTVPGTHRGSVLHLCSGKANDVYGQSECKVIDRSRFRALIWRHPPPSRRVLDSLALLVCCGWLRAISFRHAAPLSSSL